MDLFPELTKDMVLTAHCSVVLWDFPQTICVSATPLRLQKKKGLEFTFTPNELETDIHPNTVDIHMVNESGQEMTVRGESLGGGKVRIVRINSVQVDFTGEYSAVIVTHQDKPGVVAYITKCLSDRT